MSGIKYDWVPSLRDAPINLPHGRGEWKFSRHSIAIGRKRPGISYVEGVFARFSALNAQLAHTRQLFSSHPQVRQGEQRGQLGCVFHQPTKAHFHVTELAFDHPKWMLNLGSCLSLAVLDLALGLVKHTAFIQLGIRATARCDLPDDVTTLYLCEKPARVKASPP